MIDERISLACGSGGRAMHALLEKVIFPRLNNPLFQGEEDAALLPLEGATLAFSTDSYVVSPLFFPGGDIGRLAINGTVNDLAMRGAIPRYLSLGLILEEGFPLADLERILDSMGQAALEAHVQVVTGDTKVVARGQADGLFVNTSGVGLVPPGIAISAANAQVGDSLILNGGLGEHGIAVLSQREGLGFEAEVVSDTAPLNGLVAELLSAGEGIRALRDPTRGGLAASLNEIARSSRVGMIVEEEALLIQPAVAAACELLGLDPLYLANEGKMIACVHPAEAGKILSRMRGHRYGQESRIIGRVTADHPGRVVLNTAIGGSRIVDIPAGELLPRIC
ncbi:MAG: hydrogenase expression/formation protein HypE [Nitrospinae bacterium]|nr:hydrogenase expression/formation protein HypE [Nitrospinota bacterium]